MGKLLLGKVWTPFEATGVSNNFLLLHQDFRFLLQWALDRVKEYTMVATRKRGAEFVPYTKALATQRNSAL